jgi:hypothetical protein
VDLSGGMLEAEESILRAVNTVTTKTSITGRTQAGPYLLKGWGYARGSRTVRALTRK